MVTGGLNIGPPRNTEITCPPSSARQNIRQNIRHQEYSPEYSALSARQESPTVEIPTVISDRRISDRH